MIDKSVESALVGKANKELAYLQQFDQPLLPFRRIRRGDYQYQEQSPSDHIANLQRYLLIASLFISKDPSLNHFRIRHPDFQESNIVVSRSSDYSLHIVTVLDWQHASILPAFLLAGIPQRLQNYNDHVFQSMTRPSLPENFDDLDEDARSFENELHRRRLVHYHYVKSTEECNEVHRAALEDYVDVLRRRLFEQAGGPWEGETIALKVDLIEAMLSWEALTGGGGSCPIVFDDEDVRKTLELDAALKRADENMRLGQNFIGFGEEGWVPKDLYEGAWHVARSSRRLS